MRTADVFYEDKVKPSMPEVWSRILKLTDDITWQRHMNWKDEEAMIDYEKVYGTPAPVHENSLI